MQNLPPIQPAPNPRIRTLEADIAQLEEKKTKLDGAEHDYLYKAIVRLTPRTPKLFAYGALAPLGRGLARTSYLASAVIAMNSLVSPSARGDLAGANPSLQHGLAIGAGVYVGIFLLLMNAVSSREPVVAWAEKLQADFDDKISKQDHLPNWLGELDKEVVAKVSEKQQDMAASYVAAVISFVVGGAVIASGPAAKWAGVTLGSSIVLHLAELVFSLYFLKSAARKANINGESTPSILHALASPQLEQREQADRLWSDLVQGKAKAWYRDLIILGGSIAAVSVSVSFGTKHGNAADAGYFVQNCLPAIALYVDAIKHLTDASEKDILFLGPLIQHSAHVLRQKRVDLQTEMRKIDTESARLRLGA